MNEQMDEIRKALRGFYYTAPVIDTIFFRRVWATKTDDTNVTLAVSLLIPKAERTSMEQHWTSHLRCAYRHGGQRYGRHYSME